MRNIPIVTRYLLIINVLGFLACVMMGGSEVHLLDKSFTDYKLNNILGLFPFKAEEFAFYQLFTYMFMHGGWMHLFFNMFALWMFGCVVEHVLGAKKFLFYYMYLTIK